MYKFIVLKNESHMAFLQGELPWEWIFRFRYSLIQV